MKGRRALLKLFAGAAALGGSGMRVKDLTAVAARVDGPVSEGWGVEATNPCTAEYDPIKEALYRRIREARSLAYSALEDHLDAARAPIPEPIASMRSWSPVFKRSVARKELMELRKLCQMLDRPVEFVPAQLLDVLTGGPDER